VKSSSNENICFCPLYGILDVIARKWALLIIAILGNEGCKGFNELYKELKGISPRTLSKNLKELAKHKLLIRKIVSSNPPRVKYCLSDDGWKLRESLIPLLIWVSERNGHSAEWCPIKMKAKHKI